MILRANAKPLRASLESYPSIAMVPNRGAGGLGGCSGGDREMIPYLVRAAAAVGIDGLFLETHEDPSKAKCDGPNQIPLDELPALLDEVLRIRG